jgi:hypothetical protein
VFVLMFAGRPTDDVLAAQLESTLVAEAAGDWMSATFAATGRSEYQIGADSAEAEAWAVRSMDSARRAGNPFAMGLAALARGRFLSYDRRIAEARPWFAEAAARFASMRDHRMELVTKSDFAHAMRRAGDLDGAEAAYREVVPEWQRLGHRGAVANLLESYAFVAVERGDARRAAVLLGAAERLRIAANSTMLAPERLEYDGVVAAIRKLLAEDELAGAWSRGGAMTPDDAVTFAISG